MTRLLNTAFAYLAAGLLAGLYYRELTTSQDWPAGQYTQLGVLHTHLLVLGFFAFLILLALERALAITRAARFEAFYWTWNAGVVLTTTMLAVHGTMAVLGKEVGAAVSGIAGLGHITITVASVLLYLVLRERVQAVEGDRAGQVDAAA